MSIVFKVVTVLFGFEHFRSESIFSREWPRQLDTYFAIFQAVRTDTLIVHVQIDPGIVIWNCDVHIRAGFIQFDDGVKLFLYPGVCNSLHHIGNIFLMFH